MLASLLGKRLPMYFLLSLLLFFVVVVINP